MLDPNQPFGLRWFVPEILRQKIAFRDIAIAAIILQVLALSSPIFFQLVIDKVLVHQSSSTLWVLGVGILIAMIFESVFGYLRQILLLAATNKIDIRLTCRTFSHLLSLPIDYFETHSAGVIVRHVQQLESIRNFLTGRLFFTALDTVGLLIFLPILFYYSFKLALIVLAFAIVIAAVIAVLLPTFRRRLDALYSAEGKRQALLVETIHGMRTVKALAIEPKQRRTWEQSSAAAINAHYQVGHLGSPAVPTSLGKVLPVVVIVIGRRMSLTDHRSVRLRSRLGAWFPPTQIVGLITNTSRRRCRCACWARLNRARGASGAGLRSP
jgi:ATP-binding cassette subfamily B protein